MSQDPASPEAVRESLSLLPRALGSRPLSEDGVRGFCVPPRRLPPVSHITPAVSASHP